MRQLEESEAAQIAAGAQTQDKSVCVTICYTNCVSCGGTCFAICTRNC